MSCKCIIAIMLNFSIDLPYTVLLFFSVTCFRHSQENLSLIFTVMALQGNSVNVPYTILCIACTIDSLSRTVYASYAKLLLHKSTIQYH